MEAQNTNEIRRPRRMARAPQPGTTPAIQSPTKASRIEGLLIQLDGASLVDMCEATDWLPHTCRAFLTGLRKKGWRLERSRREDGISIYKCSSRSAAI